MDLLYRRPDGTFVADMRGMPYHVTKTDPHWKAAKVEADKLGAALPFEPVPPAVEASAPRVSFLEFMGLFTRDEQRAIAGAAMADVDVKIWYDRAVGAQFIALDDPRLAEGLQMMAGAGLISAERCDSVLANRAP